MSDKLSPKDLMYCLFMHQGMTQIAAWKKSHPLTQASDANIAMMASRKRAEDKIQTRLDALEEADVISQGANESMIVTRLLKLVDEVKEGSPKVSALLGIAKIKGVLSAERKNDKPALTLDEVKTNLEAALQERDEILEKDTVH